MKVNNRFLTLALSIIVVFLVATITLWSYYIIDVPFSEAPKNCFEKYPSEVVREMRPFRFFLHPTGTDLIISSSIFGNGDKTERFFEHHIRKEMLVIMKEIEAGLNRSAIVFDIGANIGLHTLFFAAAGYEVHAFEPLPLNYEILECSVVASQFDKVFLNKFGLSSISSDSSCMTVENLNIGHSVVASSSSTTCSNNVVLKRLDTYLTSYLPEMSPDLIKIDVEGHEFLALESTKSHFLKFGPPKHIFSEFCPSFIKAAGSNPLDYLVFLWDLGLKVQFGHEIVTTDSILYQNLIDPENEKIYDIHAYL